MDYKTLFQLAQDKGYQYQFVHPLFTKEHEKTNFLFLELTLIQKWLRDEHKMKAIALPYSLPAAALEISEVTWIWMIHRVKSSTATEVKYFDTYEEALLNGINEALKLIP